MDALPTTTADWVSVGGFLFVSLVVTSVRRTFERARPAIAAGLAALLLVGVVTYYVTP